MRFRIYKAGPSWVIYCRFKRAGLIHWSHPSLWRAISTFPYALYRHLKLCAATSARKPSPNGIAGTLWNNDGTPRLRKPNAKD